MGAIWNLKGKLIDDILTDLEALKNDPEIPMPIIEVDPATVEDFERYVKRLPIIGAGEAVGEEEEERLKKSKKNLISLKQKSVHCHLEVKTDGLPEDLWPHIMND